MAGGGYTGVHEFIKWCALYASHSSHRKENILKGCSTVCVEHVLPGQSTAAAPHHPQLCPQLHSCF